MGEIFKKFQSFDIDYVDYYCNGRRKWREKKNYFKLIKYNI